MSIKIFREQPWILEGNILNNNFVFNWYSKFHSIICIKGGGFATAVATDLLDAFIPMYD